MNWPFIFGISFLVILTLGLSAMLHFFKKNNTVNNLNLYEQIDILKNNNSKEAICAPSFKIVPINIPLGIFIDYENCHNFYFEFSIIESIIKDYTKHTLDLLFYDEEHFSNSSIISIGSNNVIEKDKKHDLILIKYKLLKDVLYKQETFYQVTSFLESYIISKLNITLLNPDNSINFKDYKEKHIHILKEMDKRNMYSIACKAQLRLKKFFFIKIDYNKLERFFINKETINVYKLFLKKIVDFISTAIETMTNLKQQESADAYQILVTFRTNNTKFSLSPHRIIINERKELKIIDLKDFVRNLIINMKHKVLHVLGLPHSYFFDSVMKCTEEKIQKDNLFYFFPRDINMLHICYDKSNITKNQYAFNNNNNNIMKSELELNLFINNYDLFLKRYNSLVFEYR